VTEVAGCNDLVEVDVAQIEIDGSDILLKLSILEKALSFGGDRRVPVSLVRLVEQAAHAASTARDTPSFIPPQRFGTVMPGVLPYGSLRTVAGWDLLAVVGDRQGARVDFAAGSPFNRLIATVRDPEATVEAIRAALLARP
jgi:hypothetical protein